MEDSSFKFGVIRDTSIEKSNILTISELCEIAGVSRSGYYAWLSSEQKRAARLTGFVVTPRACAAFICGCCIPASG